MTAQETRDTVARMIRAQLGIPNTPPATWGVETQIAYNKAFAAYINTHPELFTVQDRATAADVSNSEYAPIPDQTLISSVGIFGEAFADNVVSAGDKVADVGRGALDGVSLIGKLIPYIVGAAALITVYAFYKRAVK